MSTRSWLRLLRTEQERLQVVRLKLDLLLTIPTPFCRDSGIKNRKAGYNGKSKAALNWRIGLCERA